MANKIYLYPVWIRLWHALNAILCLVLITTGLNMQYANIETAFIPFNTAVSWHNIAGVTLSFSYLIYFFGNIVTKNGKFYLTKISGLFTRIIKQLQYYTIGIFKGAKVPFPITEENKFNPAQHITYVVIMYLIVPLVIISGWFMLFPELLVRDIFGMNGIFVTDSIHIVAGFFISFFLIVHIYFCTIGATPTSNFKGMINGWHESHD